MENLPCETLTHGGLTIQGYSRAAVQSYWLIPELKLGFELGASPWSFMGNRTWLVTHGHLDHLAALPVFVARRRMMKMEPPVIYLPAEIVDDAWRVLKAWQRLDRGRMNCELIGVKPGELIALSREHRVAVFPTKHTVPSCGYIVYDVRKKLKPEYQGLRGDEIRDLRQQGLEVAAETLTPLVCFTGDTNPAGLDAHPERFLGTSLEVTAENEPHAPSCIALSANCSICCSSSGVAARFTFPMTSERRLPCGIR